MTERMSVSQFRAMQANSAPNKGRSRERRSNKFGARKTVRDGISFDSEKEAKRYDVLKLKERAGLIRDLKLQHLFYLEGPGGFLRGESGRKLFYRADFTYQDTETGAFVIEDAKGFKTPEYLLKKSILASMGFVIREV